MPKRAKATLWSHSVGDKPNRVTVFERRAGGVLYIRAWDPTMGVRGGWRKRSLKHRDKEAAKTAAAKEHAKLCEGDQSARDGRVTLTRLFSLYERHRTPQKGEKEQREDARRIRMWTRVLGASADPHRISRHAWETFFQARSSGAIDAEGQPVPAERRGRVGTRSVERDLRFLLAVLNWGMTWQAERGYLLRENCCRGYELPREKNPRRPVASDARVEAIRLVAHRVMMDVTWGEKRQRVPSHFPVIFELAVETGRRLGAIVNLRYADLLLERGPHGCIRWRADSDKQGRESVVPISPSLRRTLDALLRRRAGIGDAPLFPSPVNPAEPVDPFLPDKWLRKAEELAKLEPLEGSLWHAYRRRWATVRKHLPAVGVAKAGGWAGPHTLQTVYQQPDEDTMYEVVVGGGQLREAGGSRGSAGA